MEKSFRMVMDDFKKEEDPLHRADKMFELIVNRAAGFSDEKYDTIYIDRTFKGRKKDLLINIARIVGMYKSVNFVLSEEEEIKDEYKKIEYFHFSNATTYDLKPNELIWETEGASPNRQIVNIFQGVTEEELDFLADVILVNTSKVKE